MTDKEKLNKLKELADKMAHSSEYLASDASHLHKAVYEYRQFIIQHWNEEEPISEDLEEETIRKYIQEHLVSHDTLYKGTIDELEVYEPYDLLLIAKWAAKWQKKQTINKSCEWLKENKNHPFVGCEDPCLSGYLTDRFIEEFKQALEGEK